MSTPLKLERSRVSPEVLNNFFDYRQLFADFPPEDIHNMDESGFMEGSQAKRKVYGAAELPQLFTRTDGSRRSTTVIECVSAAGGFIDPLIIFKGATVQQQWFSNDVSLIGGAKFTCSNKGFITGAIMVKWLEELFNPQTCHHHEDGTPNYQIPRLLILDGASVHKNKEFTDLCKKLNIELLYLPPNTSHISQPLDVSIFGPMKSFYRTALRDTTLVGGRNLTGIHRFIKCFLRARIPALKAENIKSGFRATGLYPIDRDRMLRNPHLAISEASKAYTSASLVDSFETLNLDYSFESLSSSSSDTDSILDSADEGSALSSEDTTDLQFTDSHVASGGTQTPPRQRKATGLYPTPKSLKEVHHLLKGLGEDQNERLDAFLRFTSVLIADNAQLRKTLKEMGADNDILQARKKRGRVGGKDPNEGLIGRLEIYRRKQLSFGKDNIPVQEDLEALENSASIVHEDTAGTCHVIDSSEDNDEALGHPESDSRPSDSDSDCDSDFNSSDFETTPNDSIDKDYQAEEVQDSDDDYFSQ